LLAATWRLELSYCTARPFLSFISPPSAAGHLAAVAATHNAFIKVKNCSVGVIFHTLQVGAAAAAGCSVI
jgi:hypothetical protein